MLANGTSVGVVTINAMFLLVKGKPFVNHLNYKCLLQKAKAGKGATMA